MITMSTFQYKCFIDDMADKLAGCILGNKLPVDIMGPKKLIVPANKKITKVMIRSIVIHRRFILSKVENYVGTQKTDFYEVLEEITEQFSKQEFLATIYELGRKLQRAAREKLDVIDKLDMAQRVCEMHEGQMQKQAIIRSDDLKQQQEWHDEKVEKIHARHKKLHDPVVKSFKSIKKAYAMVLLHVDTEDLKDSVFFLNNLIAKKVMT